LPATIPLDQAVWLVAAQSNIVLATSHTYRTLAVAMTKYAKAAGNEAKAAKVRLP
jgi:hypothetical protein